jgi:hypothetical protein
MPPPAAAVQQAPSLAAASGGATFRPALRTGASAPRRPAQSTRAAIAARLKAEHGRKALRRPDFAGGGGANVGLGN